jgi:hypothetical protein
MIRAALPDLNFASDTSLMVGNGDRVVLRGTVTGTHTGSDRVCPERWPHRSLFQVGNTSRQRARTKDHGEVFRLLIGEPTGDNSAIPN